MAEKLNCWERMKCGMENSCPAAKAKYHDGIHGGRNAGRACWAVVGTDVPVGNDIGGVMAKQRGPSCTTCPHYIEVTEAEISVLTTAEIIKLTKQRKAKAEAGS